MEGIVLTIMLAVVVEAVVEYIKTIGRTLWDGDWKTALTQLTAIACGVLLCFSAGADLFEAVGLTFGWQWLGRLLTGVLISRGANYVSDFIKRLREKGAYDGK